eukprot:m.181369 g.181369  ORF g.181369 m.181369 type:complete len:677 (-) comp32060_c0_seq1:7-2037(-)
MTVVRTLPLCVARVFAIVVVISSQSAVHVHGSRFNVLLLVADDLRPEIGCFGGRAHTPVLDALAKDSLVLAANYVQQSVCGPTRASFLVGRRPNTLRTVTHTTPTYWRDLAGNFSTIPQMFKEEGYFTQSFGKVFDLRTSGQHRSPGFICDGLYSWSVPPEYCGTKTWAEDAKFSQGQSHTIISDADEPLTADATISSAAVARLNGSNGTLPSPWFMGVGLHRPHLPFIVPQRFVDLYPPGYVELPPNRFAPGGMPDAASECAGGGTKCSPGHSSFELWEQYTFNMTTPLRWSGWNGTLNHTLPSAWAIELRRFYYASVSHTDAMFGRVLDALAERDDAKSTVVVVIGDHGWHLGEQGMWAKCTNFEKATRAPIMIKAPGITDNGRGVVSWSLTEHVDLMPTVAAAAGLTPPPTCPNDSRNVTLCTEGMNVLALASNPTVELRKASFSQWPHAFVQHPVVMGYTMRTNTSRYTEWVRMTYDVNGTFVPDWRSVCGRELYNHSKGEGLETHNMATDTVNAALVRVLSARLHAGWRVAAGGGEWPSSLPTLNQTELPECPTSFPPSPPPPTPPTPPPPPPGTVAIGYSRRCSNETAQGNASDLSCWCQPAVTPNIQTFLACAALCEQDLSCLSWTFTSKARECYRHSTNNTFSKQDPGSGEPNPTIWSGCEHPIVCPT